MPARHVPRIGRFLSGSVESAFDARRGFLLAPFLIILGMLAYAGLPNEPPTWLIYALALGAPFLILASTWLTTPRPILAIAIGLLGFSVLPIHGVLFGTAMLERPLFGRYEMQVDEIVDVNAERARVIVSSFVPLDGARDVPVRRARITLSGIPDIAPGDVIAADIRLAPVPGPVLPGAFDGQFHAYFAGIGAYGSATGSVELVRAGQAADPLRAIGLVRAAIGRRIDAALEGEAAAIGRAMVMGDQSAISDETRDTMAAAGLAHIYSISGLHLSIVAGGIFFLVRLGLAAVPATATRWPVKKIAAIAGLVGAVFYMLLAGGINNVPALRSTLMLGLIFGAVLAGRRALTMRNVALAAIAIILIDPASVFRASFQLSFAAVVALVGIYEMPRANGEAAPESWLRRFWSVIRLTAITSLIAGLATAVFAAYHFQQTSPLGVLGNVMALPFVSLIIMPMAVVSVVLMPFGLEPLTLQVMAWGIERMVDVATLVSHWSAGLIGNPLLTDVALLIALAALAWFAFFAGRLRFLGPAMALPAVLLFCFDSRPDILVSDTTQAIAVRGADGLALATGRGGSFAVEVWSEHYGEPIGDSLPEASCDSLGCVVATERFALSIPADPAAIHEDCGLHDLMITRFSISSACDEQIVDAAALASGGVHWLRWNAGAGRFDIRTAITSVSRPWRVSPR